MLTSLLKSKSICVLLEVTEKIQVAVEAATEQLNLLCAFIDTPNTFDRALFVKYMPNYSNQAHEMRLVQQECYRLFQMEHLTPSWDQAIAELEFESIKLERMSQKIVSLLRNFSERTNQIQAENKSLINYPLCIDLKLE